jgi:hypothetical protein
MRPRTVVGLLGILLIAGCGGGKSAPSPEDETAKARLIEARSDFEEVAAEIESDEFRKYEERVLGQYEKQVSEEEFEFDPKPSYYALTSFLSENGYAVPAIVESDLTDSDRVGLALSDIEFLGDFKNVTLIAPPRLGHSPPSEMIEAGVMFAGISHSGQIFCLRPDAEEPEPCDPPSDEELRDAAARLRRQDEANRLGDD